MFPNCIMFNLFIEQKIFFEPYRCTYFLFDPTPNMKVFPRHWSCWGTVTIFQVFVTFKLLWPLATTNYGGLQAANILSETSQVLWPLATTIYGGLRPQN